MPPSIWPWLFLLTPSFQAGEELPYEPWQRHEPLPIPSEPLPALRPAPLAEELEYARRTFEAGLSTSLRPLGCLRGSPDCRARSLSASLRYRSMPYAAWTLNCQNTWRSSTRGTFLGVGARLYPTRTGVTDPFVELALGADFVGQFGEAELATQLSFGVSVALSEQVKLTSLVGLHQRGVSCRLCQSWSPWAERWVTLGVGGEVWLGDKH